MKRIPSDFVMEKYGLKCRLVIEEDAPFILELRTDKSLSKYVHVVNNSIEAQIEWIRNYKEREKKGEDYYFIYFSNERPVGVNRIYNITESSSTGGSWICRKDATVEESIATSFIQTEIEDEFDIPPGPFNVSKGNNQVLKFHLRMGADIISENEKEYTLLRNKEKYEKEKNRYIRLLNL